MNQRSYLHAPTADTVTVARLRLASPFLAGGPLNRLPSGFSYDAQRWLFPNEPWLKESSNKGRAEVGQITIVTKRPMLRLVMYARVVYGVGQTAAQQWILISRFYSEKRLIKCILVIVDSVWPSESAYNGLCGSGHPQMMR
jgi:hypothetical protein